jgi:hypothetical protein
MTDTSTRHATADELAAAVHEVRRSPADHGVVTMIVRRPAVGEREMMDVAELSPIEGVVGDSWNQRASSRTEDGSPHPMMQLNIINSRAVAALAGTDQARALAGDQLHIDLDLSPTSLPAWTRLSIGAERGGSAVIEVTDQPHTGCAKFTQRFGLDAHRWVNSPEGKQLNLRGINARVVSPGEIRCGDRVVRVSSAD